MSAAVIARAREVARAVLRGQPVPDGGSNLPEDIRAQSAFAAGTLAAIADDLAARLERAEARLAELGEAVL